MAYLLAHCCHHHGVQDQQLPILMYFHGGCWFFNNLDTFDPWLRRLANLGKFIIVSVDYRYISQL